MSEYIIMRVKGRFLRSRPNRSSFSTSCGWNVTVAAKKLTNSSNDTVDDEHDANLHCLNTTVQTTTPSKEGIEGVSIYIAVRTSSSQ
jgi:uncharacterized lipoprotein NlpE involved in copper resistance